MRAQGKNNAACWECRFYLVLNGVRVCCATAKNVPTPVMPMKCEKKEKVKK